MSMTPKAFVLTAPGTNCEQETKNAFEFAGGEAEIVQISRWRSGEFSLDDYQTLLLPGGFANGDDISSGRLVGLEMRTRFAEELNRFTEAGKAVVGICNGFQILVESGMLPDGRIEPERNKKISLVNNEDNHFRWTWSKLKVNDSVCRYIGDELVGRIIEMPSAHGEGRIAASDMFDILDLEEAGQVVFNFVDAQGEPTEAHPDNPNGSPHGITGICDKDGIVLGLMPHPERALLPTQLSNWRRHGSEVPFGEAFFKSIVEYAKAA